MRCGHRATVRSWCSRAQAELTFWSWIVDVNASACAARNPETPQKETDALKQREHAGGSMHQPAQDEQHTLQRCYWPKKDAMILKLNSSKQFLKKVMGKRTRHALVLSLHRSALHLSHQVHCSTPNAPVFLPAWDVLVPTNRQNHESHENTVRSRTQHGTSPCSRFRKDECLGR